MHRFRCAALTATAVLLVLAVAREARAVGPSLPAVTGGPGLESFDGTTTYTARLNGLGSTTTLRVRVRGRLLRSGTLAGAWGIQLATLGGALTGLSPNGRVLVLSDNVQAGGALRAHSRFAVIDTRTLDRRATIGLDGDYSVDALSPDGRYLYLIHHVSRSDATRYRVQAYDLTARRLLPGVIADKSQAGWTMAGYPVARTTSRDGGWVYTLYRQNHNYPFVHALDAATRTAVCVGIPADWANSQWLDTARLALVEHTLEIRGADGRARFMLDTRTFRVTAREPQP